MIIYKWLFSLSAIQYIVIQEMKQEPHTKEESQWLLKKTRATCTIDSSGEKQIGRFNTEKKVEQGESMWTANSKRKIQFSQTKLSLFLNREKEAKEARKPSVNPQRKMEQKEKKEKQATVDDILSKSLKLLKSCYDSPADPAPNWLTTTNFNILVRFNKAFRERVISVLRDIKHKPKQLACHLNTVFFSRENVRLWDLPAIEKEIFRQWRENILLSSVKGQWILTLQEYLPEFQQQGFQIFQQFLYQNFCVLMSHLTYIIFESYYTCKLAAQDEVERDEIVDRLNHRTIRYVVTQSLHWQNIIYIYIEQIIRGRFRVQKFDEGLRSKLIPIFIEEMKIGPIRGRLAQLHQQKQTLFPETQKALSKFSCEHYIPSKIKSITNIRVALDQDIITYQKQLIEASKMQNIEMLEKDPMLTCLILAVLSSGIELEALDSGVRELQLMLGRDWFEILSAEKCPSYFADLGAVVDQLALEIRRLTQPTNS